MPETQLLVIWDGDAILMSIVKIGFLTELNGASNFDPSVIKVGDRISAFEPSSRGVYSGTVKAIGQESDLRAIQQNLLGNATGPTETVISSVSDTRLAAETARADAAERANAALSAEICDLKRRLAAAEEAKRHLARVFNLIDEIKKENTEEEKDVFFKIKINLFFFYIFVIYIIYNY